MNHQFKLKNKSSKIEAHSSCVDLAPFEEQKKLRCKFPV